ncbi:hypothetical protein ABW19_dt0206724 [Dactylella cylindrospora]|nr:hypothetical protein ABW19_dt0206724 [Dactylella cylindrospora]
MRADVPTIRLLTMLGLSTIANAGLLGYISSNPLGKPYVNDDFPTRGPGDCTNRSVKEKNESTKNFGFLAYGSWEGISQARAVAFYSSKNCGKDSLEIVVRLLDDRNSIQLVNLSGSNIPPDILSYRAIDPDNPSISDIRYPTVNEDVKKMIPGTVYVPRVPDNIFQSSYCSGLVILSPAAQKLIRTDARGKAQANKEVVKEELRGILASLLNVLKRYPTGATINWRQHGHEFDSKELRFSGECIEFPIGSDLPDLNRLTGVATVEELVDRQLTRAQNVRGGNVDLTRDDIDAHDIENALRRKQLKTDQASMPQMQQQAEARTYVSNMNFNPNFIEDVDAAYQDFVMGINGPVYRRKTRGDFPVLISRERADDSGTYALENFNYNIQEKPEEDIIQGIGIEQGNRDSPDKIEIQKALETLEYDPYGPADSKELEFFSELQDFYSKEPEEAPPKEDA